MEPIMQPETLDILTTYGITGAAFLIAIVGVLALPWRTSELRATVDAWAFLTELSGGFARSGLHGLRSAAGRAWELGARRPSASMTRTLS